MLIPSAMNHLKIPMQLLAILSLSALISGCLGDKTVDEWRQDKVRQALSKTQAISGVYRGEISSNQDQKSLGTIALELHPNTKLQNSSDNLGTEEHATV